MKLNDFPSSGIVSGRLILVEAVKAPRHQAINGINAISRRRQIICLHDAYHFL